MYKKIFALLFLSFLVIGAASAADFKINDGFTAKNECVSVNEETGMYLCTWEYDELMQESYLQNDTDYIIVSGDNNTYNTTYDRRGVIVDALKYMVTGDINLEHGVLEVAEHNGQKYVIYTFIEEGPQEDWEICHEELMKFNENNNIEPIADAI